MDVYPLVAAYPQGCAVNEAYACTFAKQHLLYEQGQRNGQLLLELYETVVRDDLREKMAHMFAYLLQVKMLQATVA